MKKNILLALVPFSCFGQYSPPAGQSGSTAVAANSPDLIYWADSAFISRGYVNINDTTIQYNGSNKASFGVPENALGPANGNNLDVVSLGDGGSAILRFNYPIYNGPGYDFAVFENSITDDFLEFAHLEVSSDGVNYFRFPSVSLTPALVQTHSFGPTNSELVHNLAGTFRFGYGTPFDLEDLVGTSGLDVMHITHIKLIDVVGSIGQNASYDSQGNIINDPYPTPFDSGGFDLDGVGVRYVDETAGIDGNHTILSVFPNPFWDQLTISIPGQGIYRLITLEGKIIQEGSFEETRSLYLTDLPSATYILNVETEKSSFRQKVVKR